MGGGTNEILVSDTIIGLIGTLGGGGGGGLLS